MWILKQLITVSNSNFQKVPLVLPFPFEILSPKSNIGRRNPLSVENELNLEAMSGQQPLYIKSAVR